MTYSLSISVMIMDYGELPCEYR